MQAIKALFFVNKQKKTLFQIFHDKKQSENGVFRAFLFNFLQRPSGGVDNKTAHLNITGEQRMAGNGSHSRAHRLLGVVEPFKPLVQVNATIIQGSSLNDMWHAPQLLWATTIISSTPSS